MEKKILQDKIEEHKAAIKELKRLLRFEERKQTPIEILPAETPAEVRKSEAGDVTSKGSIKECIQALVDNLPLQTGKNTFQEFVADVDICTSNAFNNALFYRECIRPCLIKRFSKVTFISKTGMIYWKP